MLNGQPVYFGQAINMMSHFSELGYISTTQDNPADVALDILNRVTSASEMDKLCKNYCRSSTDSHKPDASPDVSFSNEISIIQKRNRSIPSDFFYVSQRTLRNALRNSALLTWQIAVAIILGILTGLLYYQIPQTTGLGVQNRLGGIFFIVVNQIFSTATALEPFIKERALFIHVSDN
jgi:ATP-binding cassette subfamily G (WHITE) protein 2